MTQLSKEDIMNLGKELAERAFKLTGVVMTPERCLEILENQGFTWERT